MKFAYEGEVIREQHITGPEDGIRIDEIRLDAADVYQMLKRAESPHPGVRAELVHILEGWRRRFAPSVKALAEG